MTATTLPFTRDRYVKMIKQGNVTEALTELAAAKSQATADDLAAIGKALSDAKRFGAAADVLSEAKSRDATSLPIRDALARALYATNEKAAAKVEADALSNLSTDTHEDLKRVCALYTDLRAWDFALAATTRFIALDPGNHALRRSLIDLLFATRQRERARLELQTLTQAEDVGAGDILFAARSYLRFPHQTRAEEARALAQRAIDMGFEPEFRARGMLIETLLQLENRAAAAQEVKALKAASAAEFASVAKFWVSLGERDRALEATRQGAAIVELSSEAPAVRVRLADVFLACDQPAAARDLLTPIKVEAIRNVDWIKQVHEVCFKAGLDDLALAAAKRVLETNPYDPHFVQRTALLGLAGRVAAAETAKAPEPAPSPSKPGLLGRLFGGNRKT